MKSLHATTLLTALALLAGTPLSVSADAPLPRVSDTLWQQECGSCHIAYHPALLPAASWKAMMGDLERHFGTDASLEPAARQHIENFLVAHAGRRKSRDTGPGGKPLLRISETAWFVREHREYLRPDAWSNPQVKSAANCAACHRDAERGDFSERTLQLPKGVAK